MVSVSEQEALESVAPTEQAANERRLRRRRGRTGSSFPVIIERASELINSFEARNRSNCRQTAQIGPDRDLAGRVPVSKACVRREKNSPIT